MTTRNVDHAEIDKFSALAKEWWDETGPMKPLHQLNPLRLSFVKENATLSQKNVLDIGCGGGILTESLARSGANATGIDMSEAAIHIAKSHANDQALSIDYQAISTEDFAQNHQSKFDVITCMEMLEHVPDPCAIIQSAANMLKPSGIVFFSTLNRNWRSFMEAIVGAEYILQLLPKGTHTYEKFIRPSELRRSAQKSGLTLSAMKGIDYHPLSGTFSLTESVEVNYLIAFSKK